MIKITKKFLDNLINSLESILKELSKKDIENIIQKANYYYYNTDKPLFSDNIYDIIYNYLESIDPNNPILFNIGSTIKKNKKELLPCFMGSLNKIKDEKMLKNWTNKYKEIYMISDKLDGVSGMIYIKNKDNVKIYTRGNGVNGQNISYLKNFIIGIPKIINEDEIIVRGEFIIKKKVFEKNSTKTNLRNIVSGLINSKIPDLNIINKLEFIAYELIYPILNPEKQC